MQNLFINTNLTNKLLDFVGIFQIKIIYIFLEGHKILQNIHLTFFCMYCRQKKDGDFAKFGVFSEYMSFTITKIRTQYAFQPVVRKGHKNCQLLS